MSKISKIKLNNFTSFSKLSQDFSSGVNIIIGANGTGKTHLLKILYAACAITVGKDREKNFAHKLCNVFSPYEGRIGRLSRRKASSITTNIIVTRDIISDISVEFSNHTKKSDNARIEGERSWKDINIESSYIPVKEMLAHAPGFLSLAEKREISFEEVYEDIIKRAYLPKLKGPVPKNRQRLLAVLQEAIGGQVITKGEHFFLKNKQGDLEFTLLAEGIRKLALLWLLIQNGTLTSGSVLFWDEPEANLNPSLMGVVVEVILELHRLGVQVFLATHNYVILKEFDLRQEKSDHILYLSLYHDKAEEPVMINSSNTYIHIDPNAIASTFDNLYDRELDRNLKGTKR